MAPWLPPFLGASFVILLLWLGVGIQRLLLWRPLWSIRLARQLRHWDGRLPADDVSPPAGGTIVAVRRFRRWSGWFGRRS